MNFFDIAINHFPELLKTRQITRKQILELQNQYGVGYPHHIANSHNAISRGVFKFTIPSNMNIEDSVQETEETDQELNARILKSYANLELLVDSVGSGITTSMIVSGAPGIGKSHTINEVLETNPTCDYVFVKGLVKPTGVFKLLYENRHPNQVIIFDDSDEIFKDEISLNLLKGALELNKHRRISWLSEKEFISDDGSIIPKSFDYAGGVIFLTNLDFMAMIAKGNKLSPHLQALESRTLYFDLGIRSPRELFTRITQLVKDNNILSPFGVSKYQESLLLDYMGKNRDNFRELSIRTLQKLGSLSMAAPFDWESLANEVLLK